MQYLKQSTAATLKIGPFVDDTDGKTAETGLTISQADVRLSKNGGDIAQKNETSACTHDELGIYGCPIDATDTNTLGRLQLWVHESGALPVWHEFMVLPANVYDSLFGTDKLEVDLLQIAGTAQSATDLKDFADAGYDPATNKIEGCKVNDDMRGTDNAALASVCTEARLAELAAANLPADIDAILADTNELQTDWVNGGRLDLLIDAIKAKTDNLKDTWNDLTAAQVNAEVDTSLADIHLDHLLAADYDPASKPGVATALLNELIENDGGVSRYTANALEQAPSAGTNPNVLVDTTIATVTDQTHFTLTAGSNDNDAYKDQAIVVYDASDSDFPSVRKCTDYIGATKTVTLDSVPDFTIVAGDGVKTFVTAPGTTAPTAAQVADAVLDEPLEDHTGSGSMGEKVNSIRSRVPLSPWTKQDLDKHFKLLDTIIKALDAVPKVKKLDQLAANVQSLGSTLHADVAKVHKSLDEQLQSDLKLMDSHSKSIQSIQKLQEDVDKFALKLSALATSYNDSVLQSSAKMSALFSRSFSESEEKNLRKITQLQNKLDKFDTTPVIKQLSSISESISEFSKTEEVKEEEVKKVLQQLSSVLEEIENTPFDKFLKYLKAMIISSLPTETIRELLNDEFKKPMKELLEDG